jgi:hypothetical protein
MGRTKAMRLSCDKVDNSTDVASSYVKGQKIKKMLKAISFEDSKGDIVVSLNKITMCLDDAYYRIDLFSRDQTNEAYELVCKEGILSLKLVKIKSLWKE